MPTVPGLYLVLYLFEIGPTAGQLPIQYSELLAWQECTGIELDPVEAVMLRKLSNEYMSELSQATDVARPCPWADAEYANVINIKAEMTKESLRELAKL